MQLQPTYPLVTQRLRLRPLTTVDVPHLLTYRGDPEVTRYLPFEPMDDYTLTTRLGGELGRTEITAEGQALTLGVESREIDRVIGDVVLFFRSEIHQSGEIGYVFHPEVAGFGYATEACAAVLGLGFNVLGLRRIIARVDARNTASARLAERLGMRLEAHFVQNELFKGEWSDELVFAMLDEEWRSR